MLNSVILGDCLEVMSQIPDQSIDMILCDLPYGTTACKWDTVIPFEPLWEQYKRVIKPNGAIVLTASQPFTSALVMSNQSWFKYCWVWEKTIAANFMQMKQAPRKLHEDVLVFSGKHLSYYPQMETGRPYRDSARARSADILAVTDAVATKSAIENPGRRYPSSVQKFPNPNNGSLHPTQKPTALFEYLIRTYTNEGETVLDNCLGSGTTAIACLNTGRNYIGIEKDPGYYQVALDRIEAHKASRVSVA